MDRDDAAAGRETVSDLLEGTSYEEAHPLDTDERHVVLSGVWV